MAGRVLLYVIPALVTGISRGTVLERIPVTSTGMTTEETPNRRD
jgi:hypothetical protein